MIAFRFLALLGLSAAALQAAAPLPAPKAMPTAAMNLFPGGPAIPSTPPSESAHPAAIPLWPNGAPGFESRRDEPEHVSYRQEADIVFPVISNVHNPSLTPFLPEKAKATGAAVIVAPGGGNWFHTIDREGYDFARMLAARGIAAFVLKYRLARDLSNPPNQPAPYTAAHAFADAQRAIRLVRAHATEWNVRRDRVGFLGFSAGGELALLVALRHDAGQPGAADVVERESSRPDFFAPIYPGGLEGRAAEIAKDKTPPAFLLCAYDDRPPEALANFFAALKRAGVPAELHIYAHGGHGFGVRPDRPDLAISRWPDRFVEWLGDSGFLK
jgi:endo-1,4-beta-xylanase